MGWCSEKSDNFKWTRDIYKHYIAIYYELQFVQFYGNEADKYLFHDGDGLSCNMLYNSMVHDKVRIRMNDNYYGAIMMALCLFDDDAR